MTMFEVLLPVAKRRGQVRLIDGAVVSLVGVRQGRARVWFAPNPEDAVPGTGHFRTIPITEILEVVEPEPDVSAPC